jgi:hypothetical protein
VSEEHNMRSEKKRMGALHLIYSPFACLERVHAKSRVIAQQNSYLPSRTVSGMLEIDDAS